MTRLLGHSLRALAPLVALAALAATAAPATPDDDTVLLHLGVVAEEPYEPRLMLEVYGQLVGELRDRLRSSGIDVGDLVIARDLEDLSQRLIHGEVDLVIETVFPTLVLEERSRCLEPALVVFRRGQREYRTVFFTRADSPIRTLGDLAGQVLVLEALRSTSAFAIPKSELGRAGLSLVPADALDARPDDVRFVLAGAEVNQAVWVLHGKGAAGAFNEGDWARLPEKIRSELRIFHESAPLLRGLLSFRTTLAPGIRATVETALLGLEEDEDGRAALDRAAGVTRLERLTAGDRRGLEAWAPVLRPTRAP